MGTNVYFLSKDKNAVHKYFGYGSYVLTDEPYFAYEVHVMKRSAGWLPLWQAYENCKSVKEYKQAYDSGQFEIYDEYGQKYNWEDFWEQFAEFNGGILGVQIPKKIEQSKASMFYNPNLPEYEPISHIRGSKQSYNYGINEYYDNFFVDSEGFEFTKGDFC